MGEVINLFPAGAERLRTLSGRERDTREAHDLALRARNRAIVEECDNGHKQYRVAQWCNLRPASITRILALPNYGEETNSDDAA